MESKHVRKHEAHPPRVKETDRQTDRQTETDRLRQTETD